MKLFHTLPDLVVLVFMTASGLAAQTALRPLHTPAEILKIMNDSKLVYRISDDYQPESAVDTPAVLSNQMLLEKTDSGYVLTAYVLSDSAEHYYDKGEEAFRKRDYSAAILYYDTLRMVEPSYYHVLTLIGDVYYLEKQYDSAAAYFEHAIQKNFADYDAHWFLADTYRQLSEPDSALRQITIAYLLNVNHSNLNRAIRIYRERAGHLWVEWDFTPEYSISEHGHTVSVDASPTWIGYAMVKAVWKYEPGYADSMIGTHRQKLVINWPEEKEAVLAYIADSSKGSRIRKIIDDGYFPEFVLFELAAKKHPSIMALLPRKEFFRVLDYVDKFH